LKRITELVNGNKSFFNFYSTSIVKQINLWKSHLPTIQPHYAVKCNNDNEIIKILSKNGINYDCASRGEINQILDLGINNNNIIYANPYKNQIDINYAISKNIPLTVVDSTNELNKLRNKNIDTLIRVKVNDKDSLMPFSSKFGANFEETIDILKLAKKYNMNISGFSFHVGSGCYNPNQYYDAVKMIYDIIIKTKKLNHNHTIIDIGGGFNGEDDKAFIEQADKINKALKLFNNTNLKFISEPGRYFATKCQTLYTPIIAKKKSNNKYIYVLDESIYSSFSNITYDMAKPNLKLINSKNILSHLNKNTNINYPFIPKKSKEYDSIIFGRTCDSADKIIETKLPELNIGDYFEINNMGAYTNVSSTNFNGFDTTEKIYLY